MFANIPEVKLGIIAVSRGCFPMALSERRRAAIKAAYGEGLYECPVTVENELDARRAVEDVQAAGVNALVVFLGNFGPETPETLITEWFSGPIMYAAAAEGDGDLHDGRGDAYCGMLNCSYNLGLRGKTAYIPEYPVGTAPELAEKVAEFVPIARAILGLRGLKLITFGPRPDDFLACNGPIKSLYDLGVAVEENSELDLLVAYNKHADDPRIPAKMAEMQAELGGVRYAIRSDYRDVLELLRWLNGQADPALDQSERWYVAMRLFYPEFAALPQSLWPDATQFLTEFLAAGRREQPRPGPALMDWQQDAPLIAAGISKAAGQDVRTLPYLHWWSFLAWFDAIGEGSFATVVAIRDKLRRGKRLENWELDYYRTHRAVVELRGVESAEEQAEKRRLLALLGG